MNRNAIGILARRLCSGFLLVALAACSGRDGGAGPEGAAERVITIDLWAGDGAAGGPVNVADPAGGMPVAVYERITEGGARQQLLAVTQGGAALGRILDRQSGQPERRFEGDVVFPLGLWHQGERRRFSATEITLFGPAERRITLEILDISATHRGISGSLRYRLTVEDAAGRMLSCEHAVYSPGRGQVAYQARSRFDGCDVCPCPG